MKTVLCFGDSNTWGYNPQDGSRYPFETRWPGALQHILGREQYRIIEEGLNGRTTVHNEIERPFRSGADMLPVLLESHRPLDWVVIMLGTNDLKAHFNSCSLDISTHVAMLCDEILRSEYLENQMPRIIVCSPTSANEFSKKLPEWFAGATLRSKSLPKLIREVAIAKGAEFLDVMSLLKHDFEDGLHWSIDQHRLVAQELASIIMD